SNRRSTWAIPRSRRSSWKSRGAAPPNPMHPEDRPRQLPLDLVHTEGRSRGHLVVSDANRAAVAMVDRWPDWPSPVVMLAGPTGSGKSHLGAIWCGMSGAAVLDR